VLVFASDLHIGEAPGELYEIVWWKNVNFWLDTRQASKCRAQCHISRPGTVDLASVTLQKGFQRLRNPENSRKQPKTNETRNPGNLCPFSRKPRDLGLFLATICNEIFEFPSFQDSGNPETGENWRKLWETRNLNCKVTDDWQP